MAKQKTASEDERLGQAMSVITSKTGAVGTAELSNNIAGLSIPTYAERYMRDSNVYITGKLEMYAGQPGAGKSAYGFHVALRFLEAGGIFFLIETENKLSPASLKANLGSKWYDSDKVKVIQATSLNADSEGEVVTSWMGALKEIISAVKTNNLERVPIYIMVDSMMGSPSAEQIKAYEDSGVSEANTSSLRVAKALSDNMKLLSSSINGTNILIGFTNHGKTKIQMGGMPGRGDDRSFPGGAAIAFHCALVLWFYKGGKEGDTLTVGRAVRVGVYKNSFGREESSINLGFRYDVERDESGTPILGANESPIRTVKWNWDEASGDVLHQFCCSEGKESCASIRDIILVKQKSASKLTCEKLDCEEVTYEELGKKLEGNKEVLALIDTIPRMGVQRYPELESAKG